MKAKTIRKILKGKFALLLKSIEDESVKKLVEKNTIITGGSIVSLLLNEQVNDFDLYFKDKETTKAVAEYYVKKFKRDNPPNTFKSGREVDLFVKEDGDRIKIIAKSSGVASESQDQDYQYFESLDPGNPQTEEFIESAMQVAKSDEKAKKGEYKPIFLTTNAITLSSSVQLIIRFYGEPEEIHKNYDFVHCTNYWTSWDDKLVLRKEALEAILTKELVYVGSLYPMCSIIRTRKFLKNGWTINAGQYLKMAMQLNELNLLDPKVLEDQLIGVDVAYFYELISRLKRGEKEIDSIYICQLVDEIF